MRRLLDHERMRQSDKQSALLPVELHALATKVVAQFARQAAGKAVDLSVDIRLGTVIDSDADLLTLVLQNLVGNGLKYSSRGTVQIGFDTSHDGNQQVLWVADQGPGITPDKMGIIFKAFKRGDSHGEPGLGLGLAIAAQAAQLLGAHLTVDSQPGVGSTFRLQLPVKKNDATNALLPKTLLAS
jgi:signal transduction histidine kinase